MYSILLILHNLLRWAVLLAGLYAIIRSATGISKKDFTSADNKSQVFFVMFCHTQLLIGLVLYFISPNVDAALANGMGAAMKNPYSRLIAVEHISVMVIAIALIQAGRSISKKAADPVAKHKKALIFFSIGMLLILSRIPWSFSPLFRMN